MLNFCYSLITLLYGILKRKGYCKQCYETYYTTISSQTPHFHPEKGVGKRRGKGNLENGTKVIMSQVCYVANILLSVQGKWLPFLLYSNQAIRFNPPNISWRTCSTCRAKQARLLEQSLFNHFTLAGEQQVCACKLQAY